MLKSAVIDLQSDQSKVDRDLEARNVPWAFDRESRILTHRQEPEISD